MATTTDAINGVPTAGTITNADALVAVKLACDDAWPMIRVHQYDAAVATLAKGTFEYTLSTSLGIERETGVAEVFVNPETASDEPEILKRGWRLRDDGGTYTLIFDADVVNAHNGKAVNISYERRPAAPSAVGDTLEIPLAYATYYLSWWNAMKLFNTSTSGTDRRLFAQSAEQFMRMADDAKRQARTPVIPRKWTNNQDRMG